MHCRLEEIASEKFALCVVGSGPAGLIVAMEYARRNPTERVLVVEYGDETAALTNRLDEKIRVTNLVNHHPPSECTNKQVGGTSATWGGRCVLYDEIDFLERSGIHDECTWKPELLSDARKHVPRTAEYFECGSGPFDLHEMPGVAVSDRIAEGFVEGEVTDSVLERWSAPTRFGIRYRGELAALSNLLLATGWEARSIASPEADGCIPSIEFREVVSGRLCRVRARRFVLAAGAQETTRLLLRNGGVFSALESPPPALGRFYQGHVSGKIASVRFSGSPQRTDYGFRRDEQGIYIRRRFQFSTEALLKHGLLNTAIWLDNPLYFDPAHRSGAMSLVYLAMLMPVLGPRLAPPAIAQSVTKGKVNQIGGHLWNIVRGLPGSLFTPASIFFRRYCLSRKLPGVFLYNPENRYALHFHAEQVPDPDNQMKLDRDGETLVIDYQLHEKDVESVIRAHRVLDEWLRKCGCGELEYWYPEAELPGAIRGMSRDGVHQVGTTRIADSPARGVVDKNLRLWGTENLFVCSSSVFPTSGQANPTFLLGAFAVRLAHHLEHHA